LQLDIRRLVGSNVRKCREASGLSQEELAARMGVDQGYVSRLEAGERNPTIVTVWHAAEALGVHPSALFLGEPVSRQIEKDRKLGLSSKTKKRSLRS
jgi:transcriptional regulator with XRE-family HTH domain